MSYGNNWTRTFNKKSSLTTRRIFILPTMKIKLSSLRVSKNQKWLKNILCILDRAQFGAHIGLWDWLNLSENAVSVNRIDLNDFKLFMDEIWSFNKISKIQQDGAAYLTVKETMQILHKSMLSLIEVMSIATKTMWIDTVRLLPVKLS